MKKQFKVKIENINPSPEVVDKNRQTIYLPRQKLLSEEDLLELILTSPLTSHLISGYRGSGKTSYMKQLKLQHKEKLKKTHDEFWKDILPFPLLLHKHGISDIKNLIQTLKNKRAEIKNLQNVFFIDIAITEYDKGNKVRYKHVLRKLIRAIHKDYNTIFPSDVITLYPHIKIKLKLKDLFRRIDHTITETDTISGTASHIHYTLFFFLAGFLWLILLPVNGSLQMFFTYLIRHIPAFKQHPPILGASTISNIFQELIALAGAFGLKVVFNKTWKSQTIYDEEIQESKFLEILNQMYQANIRPVFILDELDKLNPEEIENFLKHFKKILLSNCAYFLMVTGQEFYYAMRREELRDNDVLASIFGNHTHIELLKGSIQDPDTNEVALFFKKKDIFEDSEILTKAYFPLMSYFTIESNRNPRKLLNLIKKNTHTHIANTGIQTHIIDLLNFNDDRLLANNTVYLNDHLRIEYIIEKIFTDIETCNYKAGINDYFYALLYSLVKRLKTRINSESFEAEDIITIGKLDESLSLNKQKKYITLDWYPINEKNLLQRLLEKMSSSRQVIDTKYALKEFLKTEEYTQAIITTVKKGKKTYYTWEYRVPQSTTANPNPLSNPLS